METSNSIYGSGLHALSTPAPSVVTPTIVPHYAQTTYPYKPRAKAQIFNKATLPSGDTLLLEKPVPGAAGAAATAALTSSASRTYAGILPRSRLDGYNLKGAEPKMTMSSSRSLTVAAEPPLHVLADKQVLRFFAYSCEGVPDSPEEALRYRRAVICFHIVDGTIEVHEPKQDNSGLIQGAVLRRHRIPRYPKGVPGVAPPATEEKDEPEFFDWSHFMIGDEPCLYGRVYRVYDVDGYTRSWYADRGIDLPAAEEMPEDAVSAKLKVSAVSGGKADTGHNRQMYPAKMFVEARLGKFIRDPVARHKFQEHDGAVLKFDCLWDECAELGSGDIHHLVLQYFLADDNAEVRVVHANNDGYPTTVNLLRKGPLPKDWKAAREYTIAERPDLYVQPADIVIGGTVDVFGRKLVVRSCDPYTREWYSSAAAADYKCSPQPPDVVDHEEVVAPPAAVVPPHNGIGSEEDSLQSVRTFNVKPLKKDYNQWALHDGIVYRFHARLDSKDVLDAKRRFTIACYPSDDSLAIYEPPIRNSGFKGGVHLKRSRHRKPEPGAPVFKASDFVPGTTVSVFAHRFIIMDGDKFTRESLPHMFTSTAPAAAVKPSDPAYNPDVDAASPSYALGATGGSTSAAFTPSGSGASSPLPSNKSGKLNVTFRE